MKKRWMKLRKKMNNAGMTLIEILVAMSLLVIAIIPLSGGYIYSARNSMKAKHRQQTSILAHTMIENCKAYNLAKINDMVKDGNFMPNTDASKHYEDPNNDPDDPYSTFVYYFDDTKVFADSGSSEQQYDLKMTIKPISAAKKDIMTYNTMNRYSDAVFNVETIADSSGIVAKECDVKAYEYALDLIKNDVNSHGASIMLMNPGSSFTQVTRDNVDASLKAGGGGDNAGDLEITRIIHINMVNVGNPVTKQTVQVKYQYQFTYTGNYAYEIRNASGNNETKYADITAIPDLEYTFDIYDNGNTYADAKGKVRLASVYLFYYPSYNGRGIVFDNDIIKIDNQLKSDVNFYLMKQKIALADMNDSELKTAETSYNPIVQYTTSEPGKKAYIHHNFNINLGGGTSTAWSKTYSNADLMWQNFDKVDPEDDNPEALIEENPKQLMYKVEVEIYPNNAFTIEPGTGAMSMSGNALSSMDGTFLNW